MRVILISLILFSGVAISENKLATSFETNYAALEKKIQELKAKGEKVNEDTRKEIDQLMVQMNHEHTLLKRELEEKNRQVKEHVIDAKDTKDDWMARLKGAYHEFSNGAQRAWDKIRND